jgi:hypothetical protein
VGRVMPIATIDCLSVRFSQLAGSRGSSGLTASSWHPYSDPLSATATCIATWMSCRPAETCLAVLDPRCVRVCTDVGCCI